MPAEDLLPAWTERGRLAFDAVPHANRVRLFGVDYAAVNLGTAGVLYVTRHGWPVLPGLLPDAWYTNRYFARHGKRMAIATGSVYHVRSKYDRLPLEMLVKFSRVGQAVPVWVEPDMSMHITRQDIDAARFVGPFEEFGICEDMRASRVRVKRPLAIYVPPNVFEPWQMGRIDTDFAHSLRLQVEDPTHGGADILLDIHRDYILLYGWVDGDNAQTFFEAGALSEQQFLSLVPRVAKDLAARGFKMLDIKPVHLILRRRRRNHEFLTCRGELAYVLVDYELVVRTGPRQP